MSEIIYRVKIIMQKKLLKKYRILSKKYNLKKNIFG